jgi:hypothetical protein
MKILMRKKLTNKEKQNIHNLIRNKYNWQKIADQTIAAYENALRHS